MQNKSSDEELLQDAFLHEFPLSSRLIIDVPFAIHRSDAGEEIVAGVLLIVRFRVMFISHVFISRVSNRRLSICTVTIERATNYRF